MGNAPKLLVSEIFCSFQGESTLAGLPTIFIRLAGCNLNCSICDTKYALRSGAYMSTTSVVDICAREQVRHICITGGEPLFQSKPLAALIRGLLECGKSISVETNGSLPVSKLPRSVKRVIDVKTPSTGESESFLAENLKAISPLDELKFVISDKKDFKYSIRFLADHGIDCGKVKVLFSPNLSKKGVAVKLAKWIIQSGIEVRFQPQLHKLVKERPLYLVKHRPRYRL